MKILITRPINEATALAAKLEKLGHSTIIEPLMKIEILEASNFDDFIQYDAIIISSKNAIRAISKAPKSLKLIIVGKESTKFAKSNGFINSTYGGANITELKKNLNNYHNLLYLTGSDITDNLNTIKAKITRQVVYRTEPIHTISANFLNFIKDPQAKIILFFSTITSQIFKNIINDHQLNSYCGNIIALTLSTKIAHNLRDIGFRKCYMAQEPNLNSIINSINVIQNG